MTAQELEEKVWAKAIEFGILTQAMKDKEGKRGAPNAMKRSNVSDLSFVEGKAYFGYVRPEEAPSGAYYDLSFVVFPQQESGRCIVSIGVGSAGYQRDYDVASMAGTRRMFTRLTENDGNSFLKNDFTDIESTVKELVYKVAAEEDLNSLQSVIGTYSKVLLASQIVDPDTDEGLGILFAWLAQYAKLRNWGTKAQIKEQNKALKPYLNNKPADIEKDINKLLKTEDLSFFKALLVQERLTMRSRLVRRMKRLTLSSFMPKLHIQTLLKVFVLNLMTQNYPMNLPKESW